MSPTSQVRTPTDVMESLARTYDGELCWRDMGECSDTEIVVQITNLSAMVHLGPFVARRIAELRAEQMRRQREQQFRSEYSALQLSCQSMREALEDELREHDEFIKLFEQGHFDNPAAHGWHLSRRNKIRAALAMARIEK